MKALLNNILISTLLLLSASSAFGQQNQNECGTILDQATEALIKENLIPVHNLRVSSGEPFKLAVSAHIIRRSDGTGGLSENQLISAIEKVNKFYQNAYLEFFIFGEIDYINSDDFFDFNSDSEQALANERDVQNTINIYFANSVSSGSDPLCGYAYFPGNPDRILMDNSCTVNGTTLSHEIGHYLTLYHTHGKTNNGTTDELVDGSNCDTAGDDVCDTAADPNLSGKVNGNCQYTGNLRDSNGYLYQPNTENIMSYAPQSCRRLFTSGQYDRALAGYVSFRSYLNQKNYAADFSVNQVIACVGEQVEFTNLSLGAYDNIEWKFTNGSPSTATSENPTTSYQLAGSYDVELTVYGNDGGTDVKLIENAIKIIEDPSSTEVSLVNDFETSIIEDFETHTPGDNETFSIESVGFESDQSLSMQFFNGNDQTSDYILLSPLTNPGEMDYIISFDYAFTYFSDGSSERIDNVSILSKACGNWMNVWSANGKESATASSKRVSFIPNSDEWLHVETYLPIDPQNDFIRLAIEAENNRGNNFYIDNIQVSFANSIVVRNVNITSEQCAGDENGAIEIKASFNGNEVFYSLDGSSYQSNGVFSNLTAGDYEVFIKSGEEIIIEEVTINVISQKPAKPTIIFSNNELRLLASAFEIEWYYNDELIDDSGVTKIPFTGSGNYYVIVRNESGCENISDIFTVLGDKSDFDLLSIYPNPAKEILNVKTENQAKIVLTDLVGNLLLEVTLKRGENQIDLGKLSNGVYLLKGATKERVITKKIVIGR